MARNSPTIELRKVSPAQAKKWLAENHFNRSINERTVLSYAVDMESDKWQATGDPIRIDTNGNLLDGQHRLEACVLAGVPFWTYVMEGVNPEVKNVIDTGRKRTMNDVLKMHGHVQTAQLAAAINWLVRYESGNLRSQQAVTHNQALQWLADNPAITESVTFASGAHSRLRLVPTSLIAAIHFVGSKGDRQLADNFWKSLASGVGLSEREPVYAYRRWLERNYMGDRKASPVVQAAIGIKAWNAFIEGKEVTAFTWKPAAGEPFPTIIIPDPDSSVYVPEPGMAEEAPPVLPERLRRGGNTQLETEVIHQAIPVVGSAKKHRPTA